MREKKTKNKYTIMTTMIMSEFIDNEAEKRGITSAEFIRSVLSEYRMKLQEVQA